MNRNEFLFLSIKVGIVLSFLVGVFWFIWSQYVPVPNFVAIEVFGRVYYFGGQTAFPFRWSDVVFIFLFSMLCGFLSDAYAYLAGRRGDVKTGSLLFGVFIGLLSTLLFVMFLCFIHQKEFMNALILSSLITYAIGIFFFIISTPLPLVGFWNGFGFFLGVSFLVSFSIGIVIGFIGGIVSLLLGAFVLTLFFGTYLFLCPFSYR